MPPKKQLPTPTHGGAREGAGRKTLTDLSVKLGIKVSPEVREYLSSLEAGTISDEIDKNIRSSKGFKTWAKQQSGK